MEHLGIDVHQKYSEICRVSVEGQVLGRDRIPTTESSLRRFFKGQKRCRIVMECGPSTPWVYRQLCELGHEVAVVNPRRVRLVAESTLKTDVIDAEILARLSRFDLSLLRPVYQRSEAAQELRTRLRVRSALVKTRTSLINTVRGSLRAQGYRVRSGTADSFVARFGTLRIRASLREALDPLVATIAELTARIGTLDAEVRELSQSDELIARLQTVPGVGPVVSVAYVAWMDRPERFVNSRDVGACLGLRPSLHESGDRRRSGPITREGDCEMRRLLVQAAHAALHSRRDTALKRWADRLAERIGKHKAAVALARKISVLLHRMWVTGESFQAFPV